MKKILSLLGILIGITALFVALGLSVQAATTNGTLNISAVVPAPAPVCGNGIVETGEQCDLGTANGSCPSRCSTSCTNNACGGPGPLPGPTQIISLSITQVGVAQHCQTADVSWQTLLMPAGTSVSSTGYIEYWPTADASKKNHLDVTANTTHSAGLTGLSSFSDYSYSIHAVYSTYSADNNGTFYNSCGLSNANLLVTAENKGTKLKLTYPDYNDIAGVVIYSGQTSCPSAASAKFYESTSSKAAKSSETISGTSNTALNQAYGYTACIYNSMGGYASGAYAQASRSVSEAVNPKAVPGDSQITLSWSNPASNGTHDFIFSKALLIKVNGACSASTAVSDGTILSNSVSHSYTDSGLINGQTYNYKLFIQNSYNEYSGGICLKAVPAVVPVTEARCPSTISNQLTDNTVQFVWTNPQNEPGVFNLEKIDWRRSDTACAQNVSEGNSVFSGIDQTFSDNGLAAGQNYYYTVFVTYSGNKVANCGCTIVAVEQPKKELCPGCKLIDLSPNFSYFVNDGALEIIPDSQNILTSLPSQTLSVRALAASLTKPAEKITASFNGSDYAMNLDGSGQYYQTLFDLPANIGKYPLELTTFYTDKTYAVKQYTLEVLPYGRIISSFGRELPDAEVALYLYKDGSLFTGYGVKNPLKSDNNGVYGFMVPDGNYTLVAVKDNYKESQQNIEVKNQVINRTIALSPKNIQSIIGDIVSNPTVQKTNRDIVLPIALAVALVNLVAAIPFWDFIYYLQFLFTEPWWFFAWRKKKGWGVVYNSITKTPVDLAVVRLYDAKTRKLLQSRVTDKEGRYIFLVGEGQYYMEAVNPKFEYPSKIVGNATEDSKYMDIYHGEPITIKEGSRGIIVANIPLDQKGLNVSNNQIMSEFAQQKLKRGIALIGPILAVISLIILPGLLTVILTIVHLFLYFMFRRLALRHRAKDWGVIYDAKVKKPLDKAITRIYSPEYGRMLDYYVTDKYGRYGFLAGHNTYYLTAEKDGFSSYKTNNIDLKGKDGDKVVGFDINLRPASESQPPQSSNNS